MTPELTSEQFWEQTRRYLADAAASIQDAERRGVPGIYRSPFPWGSTLNSVWWTSWRQWLQHKGVMFGVADDYTGGTVLVELTENP
jgi:hypothetical protein